MTDRDPDDCACHDSTDPTDSSHCYGAGGAVRVAAWRGHSSVTSVLRSPSPGFGTGPCQLQVDLYKLTLYLIRHGSAGERRAWTGDDLWRPLSSRGRKQAAAICAELRNQPVAGIFSSMASRCVETVEPLAAAKGLEVEISAALGEGAAISAAAGLAMASAGSGGDTVLCSHGDVIPSLLATLQSAGMDLYRRACQKGSIWQLEVRDGAIIAACYHSPRELETRDRPWQAPERSHLGQASQTDT